jgi:hypothetical protein
MRHAFRRFMCFVFGHDWFIIRVNLPRTVGLIHLQGMAGHDADCRRCGCRWRDFNGHGVYNDEVIKVKGHLTHG